MAMTNAINFEKNIKHYMQSVTNDNDIVYVQTNNGKLVLANAALLEELQDQPILLDRLQEVENGQCVNGRTFMDSLLKDYE
ncbi:MAG: hypothetical protein HFK10_09415 [Clostridia bacterium]|nr:hypothetical protein [Clostridia bacterium]